MAKPAYINERMLHQSGNMARLAASSPFIYSMIVPVVILHVWTQLYQQISFRLYNIPLIDQSKYIRDQRWKLKYLTWTEKINCLYCGYANGVMAFALKVAAQTEQHWCPIKDKPEAQKEILEHRREFAEYGDEPSLQDATCIDAGTDQENPLAAPGV